MAAADLSLTDLLNTSTNLVQQQEATPSFPPLQRNLDELTMLSKKLKSKLKPPQSGSFELKAAAFEDVFPSEAAAATVEDYLQQLHQMAMLSALQQAHKDSVTSLNDYLIKVLEHDCLNQKRDFLQTLTPQISALPRTYTSSSGGSRFSPIPSKSIHDIDHERKASAYPQVVKTLKNSARQGGLPIYHRLNPPQLSRAGQGAGRRVCVFRP